MSSLMASFEFNVSGVVMTKICIKDHQKSERVSCRNGIPSFRSFGQSEAQKFSIVQPLFCPETEFKSEVDLQNSVTSKPFVG
jgi:hypothetical protein